MARKSTGKWSREDTVRLVVESIEDAMDRTGTAPWVSGWDGVGGGFGLQLRADGKPYRGLNQLVTSCAAFNRGFTGRQWLTFDQISQRGGRVLKGETHTKVILFKPVGEKKDGSGNVTREAYIMLRYYRVFNIQQTDLWDEDEERAAVEAMAERRTGKFEDLKEASRVARAYLKGSGVGLQHIDMPRGSAPHYRPADDRITMPQVEQFVDTETYAAVLFHEIAHSTGHPDRTDRLGEDNWWKTEGRAREELTAELAAAMLSALTGIDNSRTVENHAAYVKSWKAVLKSDPMVFMQAAQRAQKAVDFVQETVEAHEAEALRAA